MARSSGRIGEPGKRLAILLRGSCTCTYCGVSLTDTPYDIDHKLAWSISQDNDPGNLVPACPKCNRQKRELTVRSFLAWLRGRGVDTSAIPGRIRQQTRRSYRRYRKIAGCIVGFRRLARGLDPVRGQLRPRRMLPPITPED